MSRRRGLIILVLLSTLLGGLALAEALRGGPLWRSAYPHLPRRVQAIPYQIRAHLPQPEASPIALPTARAVEPAITPAVAPSETSLRPGDAFSTGAAVVPATDSLTSEAAEAPVRTATPRPAPDTSLPESVSLDGVRHQYQTWNNCGPATLSMALSYHDLAVDQSVVAAALKPNPDDKNVSPEELADFARSQGMEARIWVAADLQDLRALLAEGLPVLVETWFVPEPEDEMGHYLLLTGYQGAAEDPNGHFVAADSYHGPRVELPYAAFDRLWRVFNRLLLVVAPPETISAAEAIMAEPAGSPAMWEASAARALAELAGRQDDPFAWFNLGSSQLALGDSGEAARSFDRARAQGLPWRMLWYQHAAFEAYARQARWAEVLALAEANLANAADLEESHYWRGRALEALGDARAAREAYREALRLHPGYQPAAEALATTDP